MVRKVVSFSPELEAPAPSEFKTWPQTAIRPESSPAFREEAEMDDDAQTMVTDLYHRYEKLNEYNADVCLRYIVDGHCADPLAGYSVLNSILKSSRATESDEDVWFSAFDLEFDGETMSSFIKRACADFDKFSKSDNVIDFRVLQQIMRCLESLWLRNRNRKGDVGDELTEFTLRCISLMAERPGSKLLLSPAIRISNLALEESKLTADQIAELVNALAKTHFAFAASFSVEVMLVLNTVLRVSPEQLARVAASWVPLAVRGLASSSSVARNLASQLLAQCEVGAQAARALSEPSDVKNADSEPLVRVLVRKFVNMSGSHHIEDVKFVVQCWCLLLHSATQLPGEWPLLSQWLEIERAVFHASPKLIPNAWDSIIGAQTAHPSYCRTLVAPFMALSGSVELPVGKLLSEAVGAVDCSDVQVWDTMLCPIFKILSHRRDSNLVVTWANASMKMREDRVQHYLEILNVLTKNTSQQNISALESLWKQVVQCCTSRPKAMEVARLHFHLLAQLFPSPTTTSSSSPSASSSSSSTLSSSSTTGNNVLPLSITNTLVKGWPLTLLTERPKNNSYDLFTLILLPIAVFVPQDERSEYLDSVLANCKSENALRAALLSLLHTVHTGVDRQIFKWQIANSTIREYIGSSDDPALASVCAESLTTFLNYTDRATAWHWADWHALFTASPVKRDTVIAKISNVPLEGLKYVLSVPGYSLDKARIISSTFTSLKAPERAEFIKIVKDAALINETIDQAARLLIGQKKLAAVNCAIELVTRKRIFVVAKQLLESIDELHQPQLIEVWNTKIVDALDECPAFVSKPHATRLAQELPNLVVPATTVISPSNGAAPTPSKRPRPSMHTPPGSTATKKPRRTILTGSIPPPLASPPVSSDPPDEVDAVPMRDDLLCSSPPPRYRENGPAAPRPQTWRNSQDRARTLKKVMMGLDMEEAVQGMKRSEKEMIYNLMFRSCVQLRTHLAATNTPLPANEVEEAQKSLKTAASDYETLNMKEALMVENGKRRLELGITEEDDEDDDIEEDDEDDEFDPRVVKLEAL